MLAARATELPAQALDEVTLLAPIPVPRRNIFCVGKNYRDHVVGVRPQRLRQPGPVRGACRSTRWCSPRPPPRSPARSTTSTRTTGVTSELDYEAELGVIIGRGGRGITQDRAFDHVWGYTIINDFTARDLQRTHKQWLIGKSLDTHCPMGPYAVSADEVPDVTALQVESCVNGERRQSGAGQGSDLRHPRADRHASPPGSPCCPATSSPPAPRPASASASTRRGSWSAATWSRSRSPGSVPSATASPEPKDASTCRSTVRNSPSRSTGQGPPCCWCTGWAGPRTSTRCRPTRWPSGSG